METWAVEGYDTFEGGADAFYPISNGHKTLEDAKEAAAKHLNKLEETQPTETSGGPGFENGLGGIQDSVFIIHPDGRKVRFLG